MGSSDYYIRAATVHNRVLDAAQVAKEHEMLHSLLIQDAIATVPTAIRPTISSEHGECPFDSPLTLKARVRELKASGKAKATELWRALLLEKPTAREGSTNNKKDRKAADALISSMQAHDLGIGTKSKFAIKSNASIEETDAPYGETLLHAAAHVGRIELVEQLLAAGAKPSKAGMVSGCTALHAAAIGGHSAVCERLLAAGATVSALSSATKRSALHWACLKVHAETARLLVSTGGADP